MISLYEYETATKEQCLDDLYDLISSIQDNAMLGDWQTLERQAIRLGNIAKRMQEN